MKTITRLALFSTLCLAIFSCAGNKNTATVSQNTNTTTTSTQVTAKPTPTAAAPAAAPGTERFVVSFYSAGEGIDRKVNEEFVNFLNGYTPKIAYSPSPWGREGELDYCLELTELTPTEQAEFIKKANAILGKSKLARASENAKCEYHGASLEPATPNVEDVYRLVVSFYSAGEGIDLVNKQEFERFLKTYPKKIAYEPTTWGREGETDYCLKLSELSAAEQVDFVRKAKESLSKSPRVHVDENAKCVHKH